MISSIQGDRVYSPLPIDSYSLEGVNNDIVGAIKGLTPELPGLPTPTAVWNLFWLSEPSLDHLPGSGPRWHQFYRVRPGSIVSVYKDVTDDHVLQRKLLMSPLSFTDWFARRNPVAYRCNVVFPNWHSTVLSRANQALERRLQSHPVVEVRDNVLVVNFGNAT